MSKILIAGGTGFVGKALISYLSGKGYELSVLTRNKVNGNDKVSYYQWDIEKGYIDPEAFEGVDIIINMTGANIGEKRWTEKRKKEIVDSRVNAIQLLYKCVSENNFLIKTLISSSATGYYGAVTTDTIFDETSSKGKDFLAAVCSQWENAAKQFSGLGARVIILRKGVVVGKGGGMYQKIAPLAKKGINPAVGTGEQYMALIDMRDLTRLYDFLLTHPEISGIFNAVSSDHITMNELAKDFLSHFNRKTFLPNVPGFVIQLLFAEMATMLLNGSRVSNKKIKEWGFKFHYETLAKSLEDEA